MKHALCVVLFFLLPSLASSSDELAFGVAKGTKLTKQFTMSMDVEKKNASLTFGGRDLPKEMQDKIEMTMSFGESVELDDEYVDMDGARPKELVRHYSKATRTSTEHFVMPGAEPNDKSEEQASPLVDHDVVFTWNAQQKDYDRAFRGEKADAKLLEKLKEDTDLRKLLPDDAVKVGDTWKLDAKAFDQLVVPGGNLRYKDDDDSDLDFDKNASGELEAKYEEKREVDGVQVAVVTVKGELKSHSDKVGKDEVPMKMEIAFDLEGEFLWDLQHKHLRSYEMHGPAEITLSGASEIDVKGEKFEMKMRFELAGDMKAAGKVAR